MIWAYLLHLSYNMWGDREIRGGQHPYFAYKPYLRCDQALWDELLPRLRDAGVNMLVIDVGDGVRFERRPEIGVRDAWSTDKLRDELAKIRALGIEPIPKLNFSTCHDAWLGGYARQVSTPIYYDVCRDLIAETIELFDRPRLFHLGMDEETAANQRHFEHVVIRQHELWWRDFAFLVEQVESRGVRPWIWSDLLWSKGEEFLSRMPKSVVQSNWYYGLQFDGDSRESRASEVKAYLDLEGAGFEQIPTGSPWESPENFERTVRSCREHIAPERLLGFLQTVWRPTLNEVRDKHLAAIEQIAQARAAW